MKKSPCPRCGTKDKTIEENTHSAYGIYTLTDCDECTYFRASLIPNKDRALQGEWSRHTKQELETHAKDVLQPRKKDGTINKHFVQAHGTRSIEKEMGINKQEITRQIEKY